MYTLTILTPEKVVFEEPVYSVNVPGADGYFEILVDHAPLTALLQSGKVTIIDKDEKKLHFAIASGFFEVSHNKANIIADAIEPVEEIDLGRAKHAFERAQARLEHSQEHVDIARAKRALKRAENRINLYQEFHALRK
ncbi:ATP synthase epsilon chain [Candidatus Protochlamydia naegleriophila]|uniref:ATP synthase epsilon chain n=1 Tax=Candidatus Protochlamydia naegleriophila TaxID=389348 RepID=A0A0U5JB39_9BACT|nr:ATP synthase F1 subunit epsilon [Candidatus Protochlamydia naegleriophila]CUI17257.1 ATP synthase epsilon chain [Candidatus Protochlamydia naegleriophila]